MYIYQKLLKKHYPSVLRYNHMMKIESKVVYIKHGGGGGCKR